MNVDVLVIAGGITGVSAAQLPSHTDKQVILIERARIGSGETGQTTAHLTYMTDTRLSELIHTCGEERAKTAWSGGRQAMKHIHPGEGRVIMTHGETIAACRDADGTLHEHSAVCPHLGCIVAWNASEHTWDCPCHGSRFMADGSVIAGSAEEGLRAIEVREAAMKP